MPGKEDLSKGNIARRGFLKGALATGITGVALSAGKAEAAEGEAAKVFAKHTWEVPPASIPESSIKQTVDVDVVIVGGGMAGVSAALAAAEAGAKVALLEKTKHCNGRGGVNGGVNTKVQKRAGITLNPTEIVNELMQWALYMPHQQLLKTWAEKSGEVFDYLIDMYEAQGGKVEIRPVEVKEHFYRYVPTQHFFIADAKEGYTGDAQQRLVNTLEAHAKKFGAQSFYNTPAQRLIRNAKGRVTGVIGKDKDGNYIKFNASKGVILATGDFGGNQEMVDAWCPKANLADRKLYTPAGANTGDGLNMALWIGATMQKMPTAPMIHPVFGGGELTGLPFMRVNRLGERFVNEDVPQPCNTNIRMMQPGNITWTVYDSNYEAQIAKMSPEAKENGWVAGPLYWLTGRVKPGAPISESIQASIADKVGVTADTFEGLAEAMGVPKETFTAEVDRYNKLAHKGEDEDFGKNPQNFFPIEKAPFYAMQNTASLLVIPGGLNVDPHLRVLDKADEPIEGLFAIGNVSGNFFANDYPLICPAISHGRCLTFGRLVGQALAKGELI